MPPSRRPPALGLLVASIGVAAACGGGPPDILPADGLPADCEPLALLPPSYRPVPSVSTGVVEVTTAGGVTAGTADATAGGLAGAPDNPYLYLDLKAGERVPINDLDALSSAAWDISLERASLRVNGGDSGTGGRRLAVVPAQDLAAVLAAPPSGYTADDFADEDCALITLSAGEPSSAFGEWYDFDPSTHELTPRREVYVLERPDGSHTALRIVTYYGDASSPMRGGYYQLEWKQL